VLFTFIDLFAGIGGIRAAFELIGGECVFSSEWDKFARKTYSANFELEHEFFGDITKADASLIPDHKLLLAGFPCQPFSLAGVSKKNALGREHGFADLTQGTLFFDVARIIAAKRPDAFLLENVRNLQSHDKGRTFEIMMKVLREDLGYHVKTRIFDSCNWVPQSRKRIIIVGFAEPNNFDFDLVQIPDSRPTMKEVLHPENGSEIPEAHYTLGENARVSDKYFMSEHLWNYLQDYAAKHRAAGNGFGYGLVGPDDVSRSLLARYYKDGSEILISRGPDLTPRRMTPRECARLMGFSDSYIIPVSDMQAYKQFGNSVVVPMMTSIAKSMSSYLI
jgi:DNA (cytosine-5)-methyltransferase 1